jgi:hypothetical protein
MHMVCLAVICARSVCLLVAFLLSPSNFSILHSTPPTDFIHQLSEFDSRSGLPPSSLCWCGVDAVALRWEGLLLLVGPYGDWLKRPCEGSVVMVAEVDGLRLITADKMSLLRRVPDVLQEVRIQWQVSTRMWALSFNGECFKSMWSGWQHTIKWHHMAALTVGSWQCICDLSNVVSCVLVWPVGV